MTPDQRAIAHWAEAAFYLSLDNSADVLDFLVPDFHFWGDLRAAVREAIIQNREQAANGGKVLFFKDTVESSLVSAASCMAVVSFVEERLVSYAMGAPNKYSRLISLFERMDINERCSHMSQKILGIPDLRIHLVSHVDHDRYKTFAHLITEFDTNIDSRSLSTWDTEIIDRNDAIYSQTDPISNLVMTFDLQNKNDSIMLFRKDVGDEKFCEIINCIDKSLLGDKKYV